ncbi:MAG: Acylphosphatase domain-containing protein [Bacteroidetes bacterium]|nr:acylphosphatase [Rhodothermaceae bacterium RA]RMH56150.1 MAG: Acylphosphatase domain-containing protein [Bacteroidota bacterium]
MKHVHLRVHGRVQGVGFRAYTARQARALGLTGWVRNEPDGTVQVVAEGDPSVLAAFVEAVRSGPGTARVDRVEESWSEGRGGYDGFQVRYA